MKTFNKMKTFNLFILGVFFNNIFKIESIPIKLIPLLFSITVVILSNISLDVALHDIF